MNLKLSDEKTFENQQGSEFCPKVFDFDVYLSFTLFLSFSVASTLLRSEPPLPKGKETAKEHTFFPSVNSLHNAKEVMENE